MPTDFKHMGKLNIAFHRFFSNTLRAGYYRDFIAGLEFKGNEVVLELGSGTGAASRFLAETLSTGGRLISTDISLPLQTAARKVLRGFANVEFRLGEAQDLGVASSSVDVVLVHFVLHDIDPAARPATVAALYRSLKIGGKLVLREPISPRHGLPPEVIRGLMVGAGFKEDGTEVRGTYLFGPKAYTAIFFKE
jgi:ubiquinone/menaquinone biosynthesis C-methylase UbiE